jgi:hypothetical protein
MFRRKVDAREYLMRIAADGAHVKAELERASKPSPKRKGPAIETVRRMVLEEMRRLEECVDNLGQSITGQSLVCVWAWAHEQIYGVSPASELAGTNWLAAGSAAKGLIANEFSGDAARALNFIKWALGREQKREEWRRREGQMGGRLTWRQLFHMRQLLVDYRVVMARQKVAV